MCFPAGLHYPFIPFEKVRIYGDISPDRSKDLFSESSHKDTPISVLFLDILVGKVNR